MRKRAENEERVTAEKHLTVAAVAAAAQSARTRGFAALESLAGLVESHATKHGIEKVEVVPDSFAARERFVVYFIAEDSSVESLRIVVPYGERRFVGCELLRDGQMAFSNGVAY